MTAALTLRALTAADARGVADIFLTSRRAAMPWLAQPHSDDETRSWHANILVPRCTVVVAEREGDVLGFGTPRSAEAGRSGTRWTLVSAPPRLGGLAAGRDRLQWRGIGGDPN